MLIVEDQDQIRVLLLRWLQGWAYEATAAQHAEDALSEMTKTPSEIVLVDITLPGRDGIWLLERIHQLWPRTVAIMMSGADDASVLDQSRQHGAVAFVSKPIERELLHQALQLAMEKLA